jgi:small subunit ribosomal protein S16
LNPDRIKYWMEKGAIPSDTVKSLLKKEGIFAKNS